jgi:hypothetical protein
MGNFIQKACNHNSMESNFTELSKSEVEKMRRRSVFNAFDYIDWELEHSSISEKAL